MLIRRLCIMIAVIFTVNIIATDKTPVTVEYGGVKTTFASPEDLHLWEAIVAGDVAGVEKQLKLGASAVGTSQSVILATGQTTEDALAPSLVTCMRYGDAVTLRIFKALARHGLDENIAYGVHDPRPIDGHLEQFVKESTSCPKSVKFIKQLLDQINSKSPCK